MTNVIIDMIGQAGKTGIDCPPGWPDAFVEFVTAPFRSCRHSRQGPNRGRRELVVLAAAGAA